MDEISKDKKGKILELFLRNQLKEAIEIIEERLKKDENNADLWIWKGFILYRQKRFDESIQCYDKALEQDQSNINVWLHKARTFEVWRKFNEAIKCCDKAIQIQSNSLAALNNKARILIHEKSYDEAISYYEKIIAICKNSDAWISKAGLEYKMGNLQKAIDSMKAYLSIVAKESIAKESWESNNIKRYEQMLDKWEKELKNQ